MRWIEALLNKNTQQSPFETDGLDVPRFTQVLVQDVHLAFLRQDYLSAQKALARHSSSPPDDEQIKIWARDLFAKRISGCLERYEILSHRHISKRLETLAVAFYASKKKQSGCYLGLCIHHRETGSVVIAYNIGFNVRDAVLGSS